MKRRAFLGLGGQAVALVAAAPALVPLATAAPTGWRRGLPSEHAVQAMTRDLLAKAERHACPPLVISDDGTRARMLTSALQEVANGIDGDLYKQFRLSTPFDLSTAVCEPDHTLGGK